MIVRSCLPFSFFEENQGRWLGKYVVSLNSNMLELGLSLVILESNYNQVVSFELAGHHRLRMKGYVEVNRGRRKPPEGTGKWIVPRELICQGGYWQLLATELTGTYEYMQSLARGKRPIRTNKG